MKTNLILINNDIVDAEEINVHPFNRGHQFGDGVYEIVPVYNGKALHAEMHMENLLNALVQFKVPGFYMVEEMVEFTFNLSLFSFSNHPLFLLITERKRLYGLEHSANRTNLSFVIFSTYSRRTVVFTSAFWTNSHDLKFSFFPDSLAVFPVFILVIMSHDKDLTTLRKAPVNNINNYILFFRRHFIVTW